MCLQGATQRVRMYLRCRHTQGHDPFFFYLFICFIFLFFLYVCFFLNKCSVAGAPHFGGPGISLESTRETPHLAARSMSQPSLMRRMMFHRKQTLISLRYLRCQQELRAAACATFVVEKCDLHINVKVCRQMSRFLPF